MSKLNFENIIREKVGNYEIPISGGAWTKFTKKTNIAGKSTGLITAVSTKIILIISLFLIPAIGIYFLMDVGKAEKNKLFAKHTINKTVNESEITIDTSIAIENKIEFEKEDYPEKELKEEIKEHIYMFTPVINGKKIYFGPTESKHENIKKFRMIVRDIDGRIIFESNKSNILWDGKIKGKDKFAKNGIYNWFIIIIDSTDTIYRKHGKVKLTKKSN